MSTSPESAVRSKLPRSLRAAIGVAISLVLLGAGEVLVRVTGVAPPGGKVVVEADDSAPGMVHLRALGISTDTPHVTPPFARKKASGAIRIAWLGESAAAGFPFLPRATPAKWLDLRLKKLLPSRPIEVVDAAIAGINSDWMVEAVDELFAETDPPDVVLVMAGNNEFLASFLDWRAHGKDGVRAFFAKSALFRTLAKAFAPTALPPARDPWAPEGAIEPPLGEFSNKVLAAFAANLLQIGQESRAEHAQVVFFVPPARLADWPPLSSCFKRTLSADRESAFRGALAAGTVALRSGALDVARTRLEEAAAIDRDVAILEFRFAQLLEAEGKREEAVVKYRSALDLDARPVRVNLKTASIIDGAAVVAGPARSVDLEAWFAEHAPLGLVGGESMVDHCHPSIEGQYLLVTRVIEDLKTRNLLTEDVTQWRPQDDVAFDAGLAQLGVTRAEALLSEVQLGYTDMMQAFALPELREDFLDRARHVFDRVLAAQPNHARALAGRAFLEAMAKNLDAAIADFDTVAEKSPATLPELERAASNWPLLARIMAEAGLKFENGRVVRGK